MRFGLYQARRPGENVIVIGIGLPKHNAGYSYSTPANDPDLDPMLVFSPKETLLQLIGDFLSVVLTGSVVASIVLLGILLVPE